jgi:hypothetical protein
MLDREQIAAAVGRRLEKYRERSFLEQFGMFMGVAQLLELSLKGLLHRRYGLALEDMERWTMGQVAGALRQRGLRPDFLQLLDSVVQYRNYAAHSLLANEAMLRDLLNGRQTRLELRQLQKGTYEIEQLCFLFDWTEEHNAWAQNAA